MEQRLAAPPRPLPLASRCARRSRQRGGRRAAKLRLRPTTATTSPLLSFLPTRAQPNHAIRRHVPSTTTTTLSPPPTREGDTRRRGGGGPREMDRRPEMRRTITLSEQLSAPDPAIRDFLKIPHDDGAEERRTTTLMDAIGRDGNGEGSPTAAAGGGGMINWKPLRDRLRLRRAASAWTTPSPKPAATNSTGSLSNSNSSHSNKYNYSPGEAAAAFSSTFSRAPSLRVTPTFSRVTSTRVGPTSAFSRTRRAVVDDDDKDEDDDDHDDEDEEKGSKDEAPAAQMSLMALLEQTDSQWDDDEEEDGGGARENVVGEDDEDDGEGREEEMVHVCCVCMVRHKGAAFIPCGHTFCRLCSRELWVSRGNCPLCNGFIQEILDIF